MAKCQFWIKCEIETNESGYHRLVQKAPGDLCKKNITQAI